MKRSLKYRILLGLCRLFRLQRIMELPPEKAQRLFRKAYKGVVIPEMHDDIIDINDEQVLGSTCLWYRHKSGNDRACIYLVGGGMLK